MKPEQKIQQEIYVWFHNNHANCIIHSVPNGIGIKTSNPEFRKLISNAVNIQKQIGLTEGIADLIIWLPNGKAVMCEVKNATNDQQPAQKKIESKMKSMNSNYILVRSLEDFQEQIYKYL